MVSTQTEPDGCNLGCHADAEQDAALLALREAVREQYNFLRTRGYSTALAHKVLADTAQAAADAERRIKEAAVPPDVRKRLAAAFDRILDDRWTSTGRLLAEVEKEWPALSAPLSPEPPFSDSPIPCPLTGCVRTLHAGDDHDIPGNGPTPNDRRIGLTRHRRN